MKYIALFIGLALIAFGCTEEIIKIEKHYDTVFVDKEKFIDRYFSSTDTVEIPVIVEVDVPTRTAADTVYTVVYDTVWMQRIDTVWITTTTTKYDTIMVRERTYGDTLIQYLWPRGAWGYPMEIEHIYLGFFEEVNQRNISYQGSGSAFMIQYKKMDSALQAYSFDYGGQIIVLLNDKLTVDESMVPLWRELSRIFLKKEYSLDDSNPMSQRFPSDKIRWSNRKNFPNEIDMIFR